MMRNERFITFDCNYTKTSSKKYILFIILMLPFSSVYSEKITSEYCINNWHETNLDGIEYINETFLHSLDSLKLRNIITELDSYVIRHPKDIKIKAHLSLLKLMCHFENFDYNKNVSYLQKESLVKECDLILSEIYPIKDEIMKSYCFYYIGDLYVRNHIFEAGILYSLKAEQIINNMPHKVFYFLPYIDFNVMSVLYLSGDYISSRDYGTKILNLSPDHYEIKPETKIYVYDLMIANNIMLYNIVEADNYTKKLGQYLEKYHFELENKDEIWDGVYNYHQAEIARRKGSYDEALGLYNAAIAPMLNYKDTFNILNINIGISETYFNKNEYDKSISTILEIYPILIGYDNIHLSIRAIKLLSESYKKKGDYTNALKYYEKYSHHKNQLDKEVFTYNINTIQTKMKLDHLDSQMTDHQKTFAFNKIRLYLHIIIFVIFVLIVYIFFTMIEQKRLLDLKIKEKETLEAEIELKNANKFIDAFKKCLIEKNNIISELSKSIVHLKNGKENYPTKNLNILTNEDWERFQNEFSIANPLFISNLKNKYPEITPSLLRLACLIFLDLNNDQIANSLGISKKSVQRSMLRLRNALNLDLDEDLAVWIKVSYNIVQID